MGEDGSGLTPMTMLRCVRCNQSHYNLPVLALANPIDEWDRYAVCPLNGQPILITDPMAVKTRVA